MVLDFGFEKMPQTFHHGEKKEGGEGVSLFDSLGQLKGFRRNSIHKSGKEGGGEKGVDPIDPLITEAKHS